MMNAGCEDGCDTDEIPGGNGEFGWDASNPIPTNTPIGSTSYLARLRYSDGAKVVYERSGSTYSDVNTKPIDIYAISHPNGQALTTLYISPYNKRNSAKAPCGFSLLSTIIESEKGPEFSVFEDEFNFIDKKATDLDTAGQKEDAKKVRVDFVVRYLMCGPGSITNDEEIAKIGFEFAFIYLPELIINSWEEFLYRWNNKFGMPVFLAVKCGLLFHKRLANDHFSFKRKKGKIGDVHQYYLLAFPNPWLLKKANNEDIVNAPCFLVVLHNTATNARDIYVLMRSIDNKSVLHVVKYTKTSYNCGYFDCNLSQEAFLDICWKDHQKVDQISATPPAIKEQQKDNGNTTGEWSIGQTILDDFVVERVLGEGGMGKVYLLKSKTTGMQFAVKRAKGLGDADRRNFLAELQTWIDLPEHPNLVPCRFFRTVGDEVLIFAEFVEGGCLKDWIDSGKLYDGGKEKALERILDTAIQFAWGLHCIHELGLVHQDVKPANVMMGNDAQVAVQGLKAMVSDFGLARARAATGERYEPELGRSILVSSGGYTPAYCSPEQVSGGKLDRRTDVWSWGLSVLEMFQGGVTWQSGRVAAEALDAYLEHNGEEENIPAMPVELAEVLKNCFHQDPARRYQKLDVLVNWLPSLYLAKVGTEYLRTLDIIEKRTPPQVGAGERRGRYGESWTAPQVWLERALTEEGRNPSEALERVALLASSRRGQLVADIAAYDEARQIYERIISGGRSDLETDLVDLCSDAALVHRTAADLSGTLKLYDRAIEILDRLVNIEGRNALSNSLASLYLNKGNVVGELGDNRTAVVLFDNAIEIRERLVNVEGQSDLANNLADLYQSKAVALVRLGDNETVMILIDRAIAIRERLVHVEGRNDLADSLASLYQNKSNALMRSGDDQTAVILCDRAIEIRERLVNIEGRRELALALSGIYQTKAIAVRNMGDYQSAIVLNNRAIAIREQLINVEGRSELVDDLAVLYQNKAIAVMDMGDNQAAVVLFDSAIEILERLVNIEGRRDLSVNLAELYSNKTDALIGLGDEQAALVLYDRAIAIIERLVNIEGRKEGVNDLAGLYKSKAGVVGSLGDYPAAIALYDIAIAMLESLVNVEGRGDLANNLALLYQQKADTVSDSGDNKASVILLDRAIEIRERLVNVEGQNDIAGDLASVKAYRGLALILLGETEKGKREARNAMCALRAEVERTGRSDLKAALDWTAKQLGEQ